MCFRKGKMTKKNNKNFNAKFVLNKENLNNVQSEGKAYKQLLKKIRGSYEYMDTLKKDVYAM